MPVALPPGPGKAGDQIKRIFADGEDDLGLLRSQLWSQAKQTSHRARR
jgi:hypothetical protein